MTIDFTKPVRTKSGRNVRILCTDHHSYDGSRIVGIVYPLSTLCEKQYEALMTWDQEGHGFLTDNSLENYDPLHSS